MTEHPLPTLADWTGDHFKSSDESMSAYHLRLMFIQEVEGELRLGWALPRRWLTPGSHVWIRNAHTEYGRMSLEIRVPPDGQSMVARVDSPRRASPKRTVLRLRQSLGRDLTKVRLDGKIWKDFEGDKVLLPRADSEIELVAFFRE